MRWGVLPVLIPALTIPEALAAPGPLAFEEIGDEKYTEQVVAMADLEDGTFVKVLLGVSNVGPGDGKGGCQVFVIEKSGKVWADDLVVDRDEWNYDAARGLSIGPCSATSGDALVMKAVLEGGTVELELAKAPTRDRALEAKIGSDFYGLDVLVPWAPAKVSLTRDGKTRRLSGFGYADHPRSKIMPGTLAERWLRFRGLNGKDPRLVLVRFPQGGAAVGWHHGKAGRTSLDRVQMVPGPSRGPARLWKARFKGEGGEWRITTTEVLHRDAPIESQGMLGSVIKQVVGNPVTYTYRGYLEERGSGARIEGIVEVTITDEKR